MPPRPKRRLLLSEEEEEKEENTTMKKLVKVNKTHWLDLKHFKPKDVMDWRNWLEKHHHVEEGIHLVMTKGKGRNITWSDAVDHAICFGWIDGRLQKHPELYGDEAYTQHFCPRRQNSLWSEVNRKKVDRLMKDGLMSQAGIDAVSRAKENGLWLTLCDQGVIPSPLLETLENTPTAFEFYKSLPSSRQRFLCDYVSMAKRAETKNARVNKIITNLLLKKKEII